MRKTLIALFAVPALAGFAFAANPAPADQIVSVTIPSYLSLGVVTPATLSFDFSGSATGTAYDSLKQAGSSAYTAMVDAVTTGTTYFAPSTAVSTIAPTTLTMHANVLKYNLTVSYVTNLGTAADILQARGGLLTPYTTLSTTSMPLVSTANNTNWLNTISLYFQLGIPANQIFDISTAPSLSSGTITYSLTKV